MVCSKCQRLQKSTQLATPGVKRKNEMYYGSPAGSATSSTGKTSSSTVGQNGISKSKLLGKGAKNPYAAYSSACSTCRTKIESGRSYCQKCAYKANACAICGKSMAAKKGSAIAVDGQKRSSK